MPIDLDQVVGAQLPSSVTEWDADDVILYHLGIGAGVPPTDERELTYTHEGSLRVLPTFGVLPTVGVVSGLGSVRGLSYSPALVLHGEHEIELYATIPPAGRVTSTGRVAAIYDKRKAAVAVVEVESRDDAGTLLFLNRFGIFLRGEGGFGGPPGPKAPRESPTRPPDMEIESPTLPQQALLYRLCGDKNPLHALPAIAKIAGFERPILHGLCSYGIALKAIIDRCLEGEIAKVASYFARFRDVVYPGETIITSAWREPDRILIQARVKERGSIVLSNASVLLRP